MEFQRVFPMSEENRFHKTDSEHKSTTHAINSYSQPFGGHLLPEFSDKVLFKLTGAREGKQKAIDDQ
jgi:hypothetical protein